MWILSIGLLAFAIVQSSGLPGSYGAQQRPYPQPKPAPAPAPATTPAPSSAEPDITNIYKTVNKNNVLLPPYPTVESCTKTYAVKCTSSASITFNDATGKAQTQSCNSYQTTNDFTNSVDYDEDLQILKELIQLIVEGTGVNIGNSSNSSSIYSQLQSFFIGQLGEARCRACCSAYATLNNGTDPTDGLGNAISNWIPSWNWGQSSWIQGNWGLGNIGRKKRSWTGNSWSQGSLTAAETTGTCGCCFTQQVETCIRVQDPNYNPDKFKKIKWQQFDSSSSSSSGSHHSSYAKPKSSSSSEETNEYKKSSESSSKSSNKSYKKGYDAGAE